MKIKYLGIGSHGICATNVINEIEETRSLDPIKNLKKKNLVEVGVHFGITTAVGATKCHILDLIEHYCIDNDII